MCETLTLKDIGDFLKGFYDKPQRIYVTEEELEALKDELVHDVNQSVDPRLFGFAWGINGFPLTLWYEIKGTCKTVQIKVVS